MPKYMTDHGTKEWYKHITPAGKNLLALKGNMLGNASASATSWILMPSPKQETLK